MFENAGKVMFAALHAEALARLGPDHACVATLAEAASAPDPARTARAQAALDALPEADREALLGATHARLRSDPAAWLSLWHGRET